MATEEPKGVIGGTALFEDTERVQKNPFTARRRSSLTTRNRAVLVHRRPSPLIVRDYSPYSNASRVEPESGACHRFLTID